MSINLINFECIDSEKDTNFKLMDLKNCRFNWWLRRKKMEVNPQNIQQLAVYLQQTLSPQNEVRKPAEEFLQSVEVNQNYPVLLLHLLQSEGADLNIKVTFN